MFFEVEMHRSKNYHLKVIKADRTVQLHQNLSIPEINFRTSISVFQPKQKLFNFDVSKYMWFWFKNVASCYSKSDTFNSTLFVMTQESLFCITVRVKCLRINPITAWKWDLSLLKDEPRWLIWILYSRISHVHFLWFSRFQNATLKNVSSWFQK